MLTVCFAGQSLSCVLLLLPLQSHGDISRLPVQLLARILQCMEAKDSLSCATVSKTWRTAADLSISHVSIQGAKGVDGVCKVL